jgi:hypothetical protein
MFSEAAQETFDDNYERTLAKLQAEALTDGFSMETTKHELDALYQYEGLDWTGRGELKQAEIAGAILAYQTFIRRTEATDDKA